MIKIKAVIYSFMSVHEICNKVRKNNKLLENETDLKKRIKIIRDDFDLLEALIYKYRKDKKFHSIVRETMRELLFLAASTQGVKGES